MSKLNMPAIVPVAGMNTEFGMEWDASLIPVGPNYTAIEATVYECLHAGCTSIWIVANDDVAPLLRHRLGRLPPTSTASSVAPLLNLEARNT